MIRNFVVEISSVRAVSWHGRLSSCMKSSECAGEISSDGFNVLAMFCPWDEKLSRLIISRRVFWKQASYSSLFWEELGLCLCFVLSSHGNVQSLENPTALRGSPTLLLYLTSSGFLPLSEFIGAAAVLTDLNTNQPVSHCILHLPWK